MCKHIAAIMYGIGARLDTQPELLFVLRGVDHEELITADAAAHAIAGSGSSRTRRRTLSGSDLAGVFGVELDDRSTAVPSARPRRKTAARKPKKSAAKKKASPRARAGGQTPFEATARAIAALRRRHGMNRAEFADVIGVSSATIARWENASGSLKLQQASLEVLTWFSQQAA